MNTLPDHGLDALANRIISLRQSRARDASEAASEPVPAPRLMVALAGAPASGKTTLATQLAERCNAMDTVACYTVVPMDGFHLDNSVLDRLHLRDRKGAPETFDIGGFRALLERIRSGASPVYTPVFDRTLDAARPASMTVQDAHRVVLVEGNYLLLQRAGWADLRALFDLSVMVQVAEDDLKRRLVDRWLEQGLDKAAALARAARNDLPNGRVVLNESARADVVFDNSIRQPDEAAD